MSPFTIPNLVGAYLGGWRQMASSLHGPLREAPDDLPLKHENQQE